MVDSTAGAPHRHAGQDSAIAKLVWQKGTVACGFFIDSVWLHQRSIQKGDDVLKSAYERNENRASTNLGNGADFFWNALDVATGCLPKRERTLHSREEHFRYAVENKEQFVICEMVLEMLVA